MSANIQKVSMGDAGVPMRNAYPPPPPPAVMSTYVPETFDEIMSDASLAAFVRTVAIHANVCCVAYWLSTPMCVVWHIGDPP